VQTKIVQISDTHLTALGAKPMHHQQIRPEEKLRMVFDDIAQTRVQPDLIVLSGDLIHEGGVDDYAHLRQLLAAEKQLLGLPIRVILGNHDRTAAFYRGFLDIFAQKRPYDQHVTLNDWDIYLLDTKCGDIEPGYLTEAQLAWLQAELAHATHPGIIFMHHPLAGPALQHMRYSVLQNGEDLLRVIDHSSICAIFSGHTHFASSSVINGMLNVVADSTAYHIDCSNHHVHRIYDGTAYNVITLNGTSISVEQRPLYLGKEVINTIQVPNTDFVDPQVLFAAMAEQEERRETVK
jgi:3',5'-cyclic-nucleotide phosphodiesterase